MRYIYKIFNKEDLIYISNDLDNHLKNFNKVILLAITLGIEVDRELNRLSISNIYDYYIRDRYYNMKIENEFNYIIDTLSLSYKISKPYSPGYGDLSLSFSKEIIKLLQTDKNIGLTINDNYMLLPQKSITSIIGVDLT